MNVVRLESNPGPQRDFLATNADIAFYGGAAGGGKSYAVLLDGARWCRDPNFGGLILRREAVDLIGAGSIWEKGAEMYAPFGARLRENPRDCRFPSGATIEFTHLQHEKDVFGHQGKQYSWIAFEELTHFTKSQFWYMISRLRTEAKVRPYVRATCNPDPDSFVAEMVAWWIGDDGYAIPERSGVVRYFVRDLETDVLEWADTREELLAKYNDPDRITSFTFILSRLKDNPKVDPTYRGALLSLPLVERERLLGDGERGGNWKIRPAAGLYFKRSFFDIVDRVPGKITKLVRAWDKAATEAAPGKDPDWTRGPKVGRLEDGRLIVLHLESLRGRPLAVDQAMRAMAAQDGIECEVACWQDPGQAGVVDAEHVRSVLSGFRVHIERASKDKVTYAGPVSSDAEARRILLLRGPWNDEFIAELESFPGKAHDDIVDALSLAHLRMNAAMSMEQQANAYAKGM